MLSFFNKKSIKDKENQKEDPENKDLSSKKENEEKKSETFTSPKVDQLQEKTYDKLTEQCIEIGMDMKNEVAKFSRAFFNTKNSLKQEAYLKFESYLESLPNEKKNEIQNIKYLEFKEKEEQIFIILKNGFAQSLSKGSNLDEETRKTIDFVFGDIKKMPSRGHRFWYYKIYIWQKRAEELK